MSHSASSSTKPPPEWWSPPPGWTLRPAPWRPPRSPIRRPLPRPPRRRPGGAARRSEAVRRPGRHGCQRRGRQLVDGATARALFGSPNVPPENPPLPAGGSPSDPPAPALVTAPWPLIPCYRGRSLFTMACRVRFESARPRTQPATKRPPDLADGPDRSSADADRTMNQPTAVRPGSARLADAGCTDGVRDPGAPDQGGRACRPACPRWGATTAWPISTPGGPARRRAVASACPPARPVRGRHPRAAAPGRPCPPPSGPRPGGR